MFFLWFLDIADGARGASFHSFTASLVPPNCSASAPFTSARGVTMLSTARRNSGRSLRRMEETSGWGTRSAPVWCGDVAILCLDMKNTLLKIQNVDFDK